MKQVLWVVAPLALERADDNTNQRIMLAAEELGHKVQIVQYKGFHSTDWYVLPENKEQPVVFMGCLNAIKDHQRRNGGHGYPFAWCDWNKLSCQHYYAKLGDFLLGSHYGMYPYAEIVRKHEQLWRDYSSADKLFIRPDTNDKIFSGQVIHKKNFDSWKVSAEAWECPKDELLCVVATPVHDIVAEDRVLVCDGKAITASQYMLHHSVEISPHHREGSMRLAEEIAKVWSPHRAFICDVALLSNGEFKLVEIGSANAAGYYDCDVRLVAEALSAAAEKDWQNAYGEIIYDS
jgi:hypothetical protein